MEVDFTPLYESMQQVLETSQNIENILISDGYVQNANIENLLIVQNGLLAFIAALLLAVIFAIVWGRH